MLKTTNFRTYNLCYQRKFKTTKDGMYDDYVKETENKNK